MTKATNHSDELLASQIKNGDINAFEILYHRYKIRLYYFAYGYLKVSSEAEEIIQNVFLSLWEHRAGLDESKSIKSFLFRITVNQVYNLLKHQLVQKQYENRYINDLPESDDTTQKEIYFNDLTSHLARITERLPDQQKRIFKMSRWDGMTNEEIANHLGISIRTVENLSYRAIKFIKNNLADKTLLIMFIILYSSPC